MVQFSLMLCSRVSVSSIAHGCQGGRACSSQSSTDESSTYDQSTNCSQTLIWWYTCILFSLDITKKKKISFFFTGEEPVSRRQWGGGARRGLRERRGVTMRWNQDLFLFYRRDVEGSPCKKKFREPIQQSNGLYCLEWISDGSCLFNDVAIVTLQESLVLSLL